MLTNNSSKVQNRCNIKEINYICGCFYSFVLLVCVSENQDSLLTFGVKRIKSQHKQKQLLWKLNFIAEVTQLSGRLINNECFFNMNNLDIRWQQRFQNYLKAFELLESAVVQFREKGLSELEEQGLIQRFEFTHELAWNVLKDFFEYQGNTDITGSRDATREAFNKGLISDGEGWMEMIKSRNKSSHTYNEEIARDILINVVNWYYRLFLEFRDKMDSLQEK